MELTLFWWLGSRMHRCCAHMLPTFPTFTDPSKAEQNPEQSAASKAAQQGEHGKDGSGPEGADGKGGTRGRSVGGLGGEDDPTSPGGRVGSTVGPSGRSVRHRGPPGAAAQSLGLDVSCLHGVHTGSRGSVGSMLPCTMLNAFPDGLFLKILTDKIGSISQQCCTQFGCWGPGADDTLPGTHAICSF